MPDGSEGAKGDVLLFAAEDDAERTIRPRLDAAGADPSRVTLVTHYWDPDGKPAPIAFPDHLAHVVDEIQKAVHTGRPIVLVVIDPLTAYAADGIKTISDADMRKILTPLARLAHQFGLTVLLLRHSNKQVGASAMYKASGSIAMVAAARASFLVAQHPEDPHARVMAPVKANLGPMPPSFAFRPVAANGVVRVKWEGPIDCSADDLLRPRTERQDDQDDGDVREQVIDLVRRHGAIERDAMPKQLKKRRKVVLDMVRTLVEERVLQQRGRQVFLGASAPPTVLVATDHSGPLPHGTPGDDGTSAEARALARLLAAEP